jgi:hypothetical protein
MNATSSINKRPTGPGGTTGLHRLVSSGHDAPFATDPAGDTPTDSPGPEGAAIACSAPAETRARTKALTATAKRSNLLMEGGYRWWPKESRRLAGLQLAIVRSKSRMPPRIGSVIHVRLGT